jgi:DNA polymerase III epsilon subunit family exonuclease
MLYCAGDPGSSTMPACHVAFDLETTGLFPESDRIVEIGAVRFDADGNERGRFERLVHPGRKMSPAAERIHGIGDAMLKHAPPAAAVLPEFLGWLGDLSRVALIAHNSRFDAAFLGRELARAGMPLPRISVLDTLDLARRRLPHAPDHRLDTVAAMLRLGLDGPHRAVADSLRVKGLWLALADGRPVASHPVFDPIFSDPAPAGWEPLGQAMACGLAVRVEYIGGTRGTAPRTITPRRFRHEGGTTYLVALCHIDRFEKSFRLDRITRYEVLT